MKFKKIFKRKAMDTSGDPYLRMKEPEGWAICKRCRSVHYDKHWVLPENFHGKLPEEGVQEALCPACRKISEEYPEGYIHLEGAFVKEHRQEIINTIKNKEEITKHYNPLERIMDIREHDSSIEVTTTTGKLAQKIGKILSKSFNKKAEYKWSEDTRVARIVWKREDEEAGKKR